MFRERQLDLMIGVIDDYRRGLTTLNTMCGKIQGLIDILGDADLSADIDASMLVIYELCYDESINDPWFKQDGQVIVQRALDGILHHVQRRRPAADAGEDW